MQITPRVARCIAWILAAVIGIASFDAAHAASKKHHHVTSARHEHAAPASSNGAGTATQPDPGGYK